MILIIVFGLLYKASNQDFYFDEYIDIKVDTLPVLGNLSLYDYYSTLDRPHTDDYSVYILNPYDDEYLLERYNNLSKDEIISSCRMIPYEAEIEGSEYPKYPVETIVENCGDCEDKSILCASILSLKGFNVSLVKFDNHMMILVDNTLIETTGPNNNNYSLDNAIYVQPAISHPIFVLNWNGSLYTYNIRYFVKLNISIFNYGDIDGETVLCVSDNVSCYNFSFWINALTVKNIKLRIEVLNKDITLKLIQQNIPSPNHFTDESGILRGFL